MDEIMSSKVVYFDLDAAIYANGTIDVFKYGTTNRATVYTDANLTTPASNPATIGTTGVGVLYQNATDSLDYVVKDSSGGNTLPTRTEFSLSSELSDLLDNAGSVRFKATKSAMTAMASAELTDGCEISTLGASSIGDGNGSHYYWSASRTDTANGQSIIAHDSVTPGRFIQIPRDFYNAILTGSTTFNVDAWTFQQDLTSTRALGEVSGDKTGQTHIATATAASSGTNSARNSTKRISVSGSNNFEQINAENLQVEVRNDGGSTTFAYGSQAYIRAGLAGSDAVTITTARVFEGHIANEGTGLITNATVFQASDIDLIDGTGNVTNSVGFQSGNLGHASRVTDKAYGFHATNQTAGANQTAAFVSEQSAGTGCYSFLSTGSAPLVHSGRARFGSTSTPNDTLETAGYAKLSQDGTVTTSGDFHEINTANNNFVIQFKNTHASAPHGLDVWFSGAAPDDNNQIFARFRDSAGNRCLVYSDGDVVNHDNSYGSISDLKFKTEIEDASSQIEDFKAFNFKNYKLKSDLEHLGDKARRHLGLIAQDVQKISPGLVREVADEDGSTHLELRYSILYLKGMKALQELIEKVEKIEDSIGCNNRTGLNDYSFEQDISEGPRVNNVPESIASGKSELRTGKNTSLHEQLSKVLEELEGTQDRLDDAFEQIEALKSQPKNCACLSTLSGVNERLTALEGRDFEIFLKSERDGRDSDAETLESLREETQMLMNRTQTEDATQADHDRYAELTRWESHIVKGM